MTDDELEAVVRGIAPVVREYVAKTIGDLLPRLAVAESKLEALGDVRDRMVAVETKAAIPVAHPVEPVTVDLSPVLERVAATEARLETIGDLRDRVVVVETKVASPVLPLPQEAGIDDLRDRLVTLETRSAGPSPTDMAVVDVRERLGNLERRVTDDSFTKELGTLRERVAVMEVKGQMPGPAGKDGADGADGLGWDDMEEVVSDGGRTVTRRYMKGDRVKEFVYKTSVEIYRGVYVDGKMYDCGDGVTWGGSEWHCNETTTTKPGDGSKAWTLKVKRGRDGKDGAPGAEGKPGRDLTKEAAWRS